MHLDTERFFNSRTFCGLTPEQSDYATSRVVILPVPYDSTTSARAGSREGPAAIISASCDIELYDVGTGLEPYRWGIHTLPDVLPDMGSPERTVRRTEEIARELLADGKFVVTLGGEHTVSVGPVRAHKERYPNMSVLAIDAHADLRDDYLGTPYNHACILRRHLDVCPVVQVGLRSASVEEARLIQERALPFYSPARYRSLEDGPAEVLSGLTEDVYITVDLDGFDPSQVSGVGTPEPGGLLWDEVDALFRRVAANRRIVGFDITELNPPYGRIADAQLAAKLAYRLLGLALGPAE